MCVIIYKPKNAELPSNKILAKCFIANGDGVGYAYRTENNIIKTSKGMWNLKELKERINVLRTKVRPLEMIIHFRLSSQGVVAEENCHPFIFNNIAIFHNGTIQWLKDKTKTETDTEIFTKKYLPYLLPNIDKQEVQTMIYEMTNSRFIIMNEENTYMIGDFTKFKDCYYSNMNWQRQYDYSKSTMYYKSPAKSGFEVDYSVDNYSYIWNNRRGKRRSWDYY